MLLIFLKKESIIFLKSSSFISQESFIEVQLMIFSQLSFVIWISGLKKEFILPDLYLYSDLNLQK